MDSITGMGVLLFFLSRLVYTSCKKDNPLEGRIQILGPLKFVTNGQQTMALTCEVKDGSKQLWYEWRHVPFGCQQGDRNPTCSFVPRPYVDDELQVVCRVIDPSGSSVVSSTAKYTIRLHYPPPSPPIISTSRPGVALGSGDNLTCTVTGGKPLVSKVNFSCSSPTHHDQPDFKTETSVYSILTVDTSKSMGVDTVCVCSAVWEPNPNFYNDSSRQMFLLKYKAKINSFTVNWTTEMTAEEGSAAMFHCTATGRPAPDISLQKLHAEDLTAVHEVSGRQELTYSLQSVRCENNGTYVCAASNGFLNVHSKAVALRVNCTVHSGIKYNNSNNPDNNREEGREGGRGGGEEESEDRFNIRNTELWLSAGGSVGLLLVGVAVLTVCCKRYRRRTNNQEPTPVAPQADLYLEVLPSSPKLHTFKRRLAPGAANIPGIYGLEEEDENFYEEIRNSDSPE